MKTMTEIMKAVQEYKTAFKKEGGRPVVEDRPFI